MSGLNGQQPATIGEQLGVGRHWQPGQPVTWTMTKLVAVDGSATYVLKFETGAGTIAVPMGTDDFRKFIAKAQETLTGLTLPGAG